ncbi:MAG: hypothetical protein JO090_15560 [Rhizobacter sp.]|nr:hypothetical protein [Rhizobacter sp.]
MLKLGHAELALGNHEAAREAFARMRRAALALGSPWQHDAVAGSASVALAQGDDARALRELQPILAHVASGGVLDGSVKPRLIEVTCHQVLARVGDARAGWWLRRADEALRAQANTIEDPALRRSFLDNVPYHREIGRLAERANRTSP